MNFEPLSLRILGALFNGGYQGLLLTTVVWLGLRLWPHTNAATRHAAGMATLIVVAALPVVHFLVACVGDGSSRDEERNALPSALLRESDHPQASIPTSGGLRVDGEEASAAPQTSILRTLVLARGTGIREMALTLERATAEPVATEPGTTEPGTTEPVTTEPGETASESASESASEWLSAAQWQAFVPARVALGLAGLWAMFAALRLAKLTAECRILKALKRRGAAPPERLGMAFESLRREMKVGRRAKLLLVPAPAAPMAVGFLKPAVLLPSGVFRGSTWGALDQILRHELAHLRRWDDWANLVQQIIRCFLFFHPAVWWLSRHLTLDREIACDDHVLAAVPAPRAYALFLTEFAGRDHYRNCSAAPAGWSRKSQLQQRITMILDPNRNASTALAKARAGVMIAAAALLAALSLHAAPRLELSRTAESGAEEYTASTDTTEASAPKVKTTISVQADVDPKPMPAPAVVAVGPARVRPAGPVPVAVPQPVAQPAPARVRLAGVVPVQPVQPAFASASHAPAAPRAPHPKAIGGPQVRDESVEERLDRLERLIESMLQGKNDPGKPGWKSKPDGKDDFGLDMKGDFKLDGKDWESFSPEKIEEFTRRVQQQAEKAAEHAQRMIEQQAARHGAWEARHRALESRNRGNDVESREHQRRMLESQRHAMEIQLGNLEMQIQQLEAARDEVEAQMEEQEQLFEQLEEQLEEELENQEQQEDHDDEDEDEDADDEPARDRKPPRPAADSSNNRL